MRIDHVILGDNGEYVKVNPTKKLFTTGKLQIRRTATYSDGRREASYEMIFGWAENDPRAAMILKP